VNAHSPDFTIAVEGIDGVCPAGEAYAEQQIADSTIPVLSCEGPCIRGEIARLAELDGEGKRISSVLREEVNRWHADLIVVGGRVRRNLLLRILSDDVCDAIISSAMVPILLATPRGGYGIPNGSPAPSPG